MMKIVRSRLFLSSLMFLVLDFAGGFVILAPIIVYLRNQIDRSASAKELWPIISPWLASDLLLNYNQALAVFAVSAIVIFVLYALLKAFFAGGIYGVIIFGGESDQRRISSVRSFLANSAGTWPGFLKVALFAVVVYAIAIFLGAVFGQILGALGVLWRIAVMLFLGLVASTYLQILRAQIVSAASNSVREAMKATRRAVAESSLRLMVGNVSVAVATLLAVWLLWSLLKSVRGYEWGLVPAILSIVIQQLMVFFICLGQVLRINFNFSIIKRGAEHAVGGTELGGV